MAKKRGSNPNSEASEDAFTARLLAAWSWAQKNTQVLIVAGVLLAVAVGAGLYYYDYRQNLRLQAAGELERIQQTLGTGEAEAARSELQSFLDRFGDTTYGTEARILLAELHLRQDQPSEAVSVLEGVTGNLSDPLSLQAAFLLGTAYEEADRLADAEALYLRIAEEAELGFQVRQALANAARLRAREGNYAGAADLYQRVLDTFDEEAAASAGSERSTYQLRLSEMQAAASRQGS